MPARLEQPRILADHLRLRVPGESGEGPIDRKNAVVTITEEDRLIGVIEHPRRQPQGLLGATLFGEVTHHRPGLGRPPGGIAAQDELGDDRDRVPVPVPQLHFTFRAEAAHQQLVADQLIDATDGLPHQQVTEQQGRQGVPVRVAEQTQ